MNGSVIRTIYDHVALPHGMKPADWAVLTHGRTEEIRGLVQNGKDDHDERVLKARVNHSRWIVDCPDCNSAQMGTPDDRRFRCADCGAGWFDVEYPDSETMQRIEEILRRCPRDRNRNWEPDESMDDLEANIRAGLAAEGR